MQVLAPNVGTLVSPGFVETPYNFIELKSAICHIDSFSGWLNTDQQ